MQVQGIPFNPVLPSSYRHVAEIGPHRRYTYKKEKNLRSPAPPFFLCLIYVKCRTITVHMMTMSGTWPGPLKKGLHDGSTRLANSHLVIHSHLSLLNVLLPFKPHNRHSMKHLRVTYPLPIQIRVRTSIASGIVPVNRVHLLRL